MPRTETTTRELFKFAELSETAKQTALENCYDWNVGDSYWYESTIEDAERAGLKLSEFDIDRGNVRIHYLAGWTGEDVARQIVEDHGETCDTYKAAKEYLADRDALVSKYSAPLEPYARVPSSKNSTSLHSILSRIASSLVW